jgi:energy-coupling factor transporter ATP-binding protein EcfA2
MCTFNANQMAELIDDLHQKGFQIVVPTTQVQNVIHYALSTVSQVVVDDIPDVQRRRRPKQAALRSVGAPLP